MTGEWYSPGTRVQLAPHTDAWMMGDRYGTVKTSGRVWIMVDMDRSGRTRKVLPVNLTRV